MEIKNKLPSQILLVVSLFLLILAIIWGQGKINKSLQRNRFIQTPETISTELVATPSPEPVLTTILLGGDVMLGRSVTIESLDVQNNSNFPFENIKDLLLNSDLVFVNLENPVTENCPRIPSGFTFCSPPEMLSGFSGVNAVVTLANNHIRNYGVEGYEQTKSYLNQNNIAFVGDSNLVIREIDGTKFGYLGFDFMSNKPTASDWSLITDSDLQVDVLIVGVHWGVEYTNQPQNYQKEWAKTMVENGADVVVGHHPHWVQTIDYIDGVPVYYSLGNLIFDQMWSEETRKGMLVEITYKDGERVDEKRIDTYIRNIGQPEIVN